MCRAPAPRHLHAPCPSPASWDKGKVLPLRLLPLPAASVGQEGPIHGARGPREARTHGGLARGRGTASQVAPSRGSGSPAL